MGKPRPAFPAAVSGETGAAPGAMDLLRRTPVAELRELAFPYPGDATDVFTLKTDRGVGYLDQGTGALLAWADPTPWQRVSETIYMLHTGQGAALLGLAARADGPGRAGDGRHGRGRVAGGASRAPADQGQRRSQPRRDDHPRRQRGRQHLGLCRDAASRR